MNNKIKVMWKKVAVFYQMFVSTNLKQTKKLDAHYNTDSHHLENKKKQ